MRIGSSGPLGEARAASVGESGTARRKGVAGSGRSRADGPGTADVQRNAEGARRAGAIVQVRHAFNGKAGRAGIKRDGAVSVVS